MYMYIYILVLKIYLDYKVSNTYTSFIYTGSVIVFSRIAPHIIDICLNDRIDSLLYD